MYDPIKDQFYTAQELADILNIKAETVTAHARVGRLPACQPYEKGPWLFPKDELTTYLRKRVKKTLNSIPRPLRARPRTSNTSAKNISIKESAQ